MELSSRHANAVLVALAIGAVGASGYAVWSVQQPPPETPPAASAGTTPEPTGTDDAPTGAATTEDATQTPEETGEETTSVEPEPTDEQTSTDDGADAQEPSVQGWREAWSGEDAALLVVGDGYSNLTSQWVQLWGALQADDRSTLISHWGEEADVAFNDPIELSADAGPSLHVWSASRGGSSIGDAADRVEQFLDAAAPPDAVLVSLGGSSGGEDVPAQLDRLVGQLPDVPVLVAAGPSELYSAGVADAVAGWAQDNADRVSLVDLREATVDNPTAEEWALAFDEAVSAG
ncbi:hypothetical protein [Serinicoccus kebangsaanensis]|uniref:hypothetical protein n=1 Tax=Serinicoccus kebangsaanensis TaxID=2602069 RepID=UPI00124D7B68|nr:hypothetical protein [Serinicoccus kebangsaanensis]